jgi:hypothetical protein
VAKSQISKTILELPTIAIVEGLTTTSIVDKIGGCGRKYCHMSLYKWARDMGFHRGRDSPLKTSDNIYNHYRRSQICFFPGWVKITFRFNQMLNSYIYV